MDLAAAYAQIDAAEYFFAVDAGVEVFYFKQFHIWFFFRPSLPGLMVRQALAYGVFKG